MNSNQSASARPPTPFEVKVYKACARIPKGKVATYAWIAKAIGQPGAARAVGNALNKNPHGFCDPRSKASAVKRVPCHRVIASDGSIGGFAHGTKRKIQLLKREGVTLSNGKVDATLVLKKR